MNFLFLTDEFYPNFGANSLLIKNIAEELVRHDHSVYVMPYGYDHALPEMEIYNGIRIVRRIPSDGKDELIKQIRNGHWLIAAKIISKYLRTKFFFLRNIKVKENYGARQFLQEWIKQNRIDCVISINCSVEISFPLLALRKRGQLACKWIWYMIDPFESHDYYQSLMPQRKLRKLQKKIMVACDRVIMTDEIYRDTCVWESFRNIPKPLVLKFPKIVSLGEQKSEEKYILPKGCINVLCTGTRDDEVRDSTYALELCKKIREVNFHFVGVNWAENEVEQEDNLFFYPRQKKEVITNMQGQADFLLNIGNKKPNQIPSKVLEYINTGKPVINIFKTGHCPTLELLKGYDAIHIHEKELLETTYQTLRVYLSQNHSAVNQEEILEKYTEYTPKYFVDKLLEFL